MQPYDYDVVVIGAGPAGYTAAMRGAELGMKVLCVDDRDGAGGTCLNVGCIPSKALLSSTEQLDSARHFISGNGNGEPGQLPVDLAALMERKDAVVEQLTHGIDGLLRRRGVERLRGRARLEGPREVAVTVDGKDGQKEGHRFVRGRHVVVATGSSPMALPDVESDGKRILTSKEALSLDVVPERMLVVGGGYIGLELGSVWSRLGSEVVIAEAEDQLLPGMDADLSEQVERSLEEQGMQIQLGATVEDITLDGNGRGRGVCARLSTEDEKSKTIECSHVLVAVGREPATHGLGLTDLCLSCTNDGFIPVDEQFRTSVPGLYAIGDVVGEPMLAHKGQVEAIACMDAIAGRGSGFVDYESIPAVVYTTPEVAVLGHSEESLRAAGIGHRTGRASFEHDARALCTGKATGFVKLLVEERGERLLGAQIFGPDAGTLVHELVIAMTLGASVEELGRCVRAHPTFNETIREAALNAIGRALHQ